MRSLLFSITKRQGMCGSCSSHCLECIGCFLPRKWKPSWDGMGFGWAKSVRQFGKWALYACFDQFGKHGIELPLKKVCCPCKG